MLLSRCPVCKATNTPSPCRRCRADLSMLVTLENQRQTSLTLARQCLADRQWREAQRHAQAASQMRRDEESEEVLAVASLLCGDYALAWRCHRYVTG